MIKYIQNQLTGRSCHYSYRLVFLTISLTVFLGIFTACSEKDKLPTPQKIDLEIKPLAIGDTVPDIEFEIANYPAGKIRLSDFKGKMVILDFWATWCAPCVSQLFKLDSLQKQFKDQLQIVLVNTSGRKNGYNKVISVFEKYRFQLPFVKGNVLSGQLFPYSEVPHFIWIDEKGIVRNITSFNKVTQENIQRMLCKMGI